MADAVSRLEENVPVNIVSLPNLIVLKCHSIKHGHIGRIEQDVDDVIYLLLAKNLNLEDNCWRELFLKYGTPELYEKLQRACKS